jgi:hypothetical protein
LSPTPAPVPTSSSTLSPTTLSTTESTAIALDGSTPTTPTGASPPPPAMIFNECVPCLDLEKRHLLTFFFLVHIYSYTRSHSRHCAAFWKRWR